MSAWHSVLRLRGLLSALGKTEQLVMSARGTGQREEWGQADVGAQSVLKLTWGKRRWLCRILTLALRKLKKCAEGVHHSQKESQEDSKDEPQNLRNGWKLLGMLRRVREKDLREKKQIALMMNVEKLGQGHSRKQHREAGGQGPGDKVTMPRLPSLCCVNSCTQGTGTALCSVGLTSTSSSQVSCYNSPIFLRVSMAVCLLFWY